MNLYEINSQILDCIDQETGEVMDIDRLEELNMAKAEKVDNIACWVKNLEADVAAFEAQEKAFADRKAAAKRKIDSLKHYLTDALGGQNFSSDRCEVRNAKLLLSKGLSDAEVAAIIGRSVSAVVNIRNGAYDFMLEGVPNDTPDDSRVYILLKSIDSRLYQQNEDMKKAIDQLVGLNSALVELQNEIKVCSSCMTAMLDALNDLKSKNSQQAEQETTPTKYPGKDFANWGEVIRRVEVYGDKFIADNLRGTKASLDGVTLYLACTPSTKKFLKSSAVAIPRIKQQCRNVIGYGVEVKIIDL